MCKYMHGDLNTNLQRNGRNSISITFV